MGSYPNGLPLGMFEWSKNKILPMYGVIRPVYIHHNFSTFYYVLQFPEILEKYLNSTLENNGYEYLLVS